MVRTVRRLSLLMTIVLVGLSGLLTSCNGESSAGGTDMATASFDAMPLEVQNAPVAVQQAYQFNVANPELMKQLPCYCGCGAMGHTSNYSCYVSGVEADGRVNYDTHALGCSICVDITQDAMRLHLQGKTAPEIKAYVDQIYAQYGPSNMP